MRENILR